MEFTTTVVEYPQMSLETIPTQVEFPLSTDGWLLEKSVQEDYCPVCLVRHDRETHAATLRIRRWLRDTLKAKMAPPNIGKRSKGGRNSEWASGKAAADARQV